MNTFLDSLISRYPQLDGLQQDVKSAFELLCNCFDKDGKLLVAGNGGSAADAEHITGELLKSFEMARPIPPALAEKLPAELAPKLQGSLPAIPLTSFISLATAYANDVDPEIVFAQLVLGLGQPRDVLMGLSTSGNSKNIVAAFEVAKAKGIATILLTGEHGGVLADMADIAIKVPSSRTLEIQELHLPIYHTLCLMLEEFFFNSAQ